MCHGHQSVQINRGVHYGFNNFFLLLSFSLPSSRGQCPILAHLLIVPEVSIILDK